MKALLISINAQYIHTGLATRSIQSYCKTHGTIVPSLAEYTINQKEDEVLQALYFQAPDVYLFSCYIWNMDLVKRLCTQLHKIRPHTPILLGGPEATYKAEVLLTELPFLTGIMLGEGEETVVQVLCALAEERPLTQVAGLALPSGKTPKQVPLDMAELPFAYEDLEELSNRILYYESMRGCPFTCSYCLSSVERTMQMRPLEQVYADLTRFLAVTPKQVKFVDRTFNCNPKRARAIWQFLIEHDNGVTNFHFELAGDILEEESIALLATARPHLFQFEIGVQSANEKTLAAITRKTDLTKLAHNVKALQATGNIHLHLDLIAGLPYEDLDSFIESFHWVYALQPQQFQLGFLKVLGGSRMEEQAEEFGILYQDDPPFQVLQTNWLSFEDLVLLQGVEEMVDTYRNSGRYEHVVAALLEHFPRPFDFYYELSLHYEKERGDGPLSKRGYYEILGSFATAQGIPITPYLQNACQLDVALHEKPKNFPKWTEQELSPDVLQWEKDWYRNPQNVSTYLPHDVESNTKQLARVTHLQYWETSPLEHTDKPCAILIDYRQRDVLGNATYQVISPLPNF